MKKIAMIALIAMAGVASAGEVTVSAVRDYTGTDSTGYRVATDVKGFAVSATHIDSRYNRYAVGKEFALTTVGPVSLAATGAAVYQDTLGGENGYGFTVGAKATYPVTKAVSIVAGVERFTGQSRISAFDGNVATVGLNVKF
jgi:YfaZ precursor